MKLDINEEQRLEIEQGLILQRKALEKNKKGNEEMGNRAGMLEDERRLRILNGGPGGEKGLLEMVYRESKDQGPLFGGKDGDGVSVREGQSIDEALDDPDYTKPELVEDEPGEDGGPETSQEAQGPDPEDETADPEPASEADHPAEGEIVTVASNPSYELAVVEVTEDRVILEATGPAKGESKQRYALFTDLHRHQETGGWVAIKIPFVETVKA